MDASATTFGTTPWSLPEGVPWPNWACNEFFLHWSGVRIAFDEPMDTSVTPPLNRWTIDNVIGPDVTPENQEWVGQQLHLDWGGNTGGVVNIHYDNRHPHLRTVDLIPAEAFDYVPDEFCPAKAGSPAVLAYRAERTDHYAPKIHP